MTMQFSRSLCAGASDIVALEEDAGKCDRYIKSKSSCTAVMEHKFPSMAMRQELIRIEKNFK